MFFSIQYAHAKSLALHGARGRTLGPGGIVVRPVWYVVTTMVGDVNELPQLPKGYVDDVSRLNQSQVADFWNIPLDSTGPEGQLAKLLAWASAEGMCVSIAGARHSMGGHTIYPGGLVFNMLP
jgi:hypothetical protein